MLHLSAHVHSALLMYFLITRMLGYLQNLTNKLKILKKCNEN